jgi:dipeptidyl aminopeptidase/acylaminoacyl peptidase
VVHRVPAGLRFVAAAWPAVPDRMPAVAVIGGGRRQVRTIAALFAPTHQTRNSMKALRGLLFAIGATAGAVGALAPAFAQPIPIADLFRPPAYANPTLSQNGRYFAVSVPRNGKMNIAIVDLEERKVSVVTDEREFDILDVRWVGNERLVFTLGQANSPTGAGQFDGGGLFMVSRDGKESRRLSPTFKEMRYQNQSVYRGYSLARTLPGNDEEVLVTGNQRDADSVDLYRMNVRTGRVTLLTERRPDRVAGYVLDNNYVARVAISTVKDENVYILHYRKSADAPWEEIWRYDNTKAQMLMPLAFEADNQTLQVAYNVDRPTTAVYRYDPNTRKLGELIAQHPRYDMGADASAQPVPGPIVDFKTNRVIGYSVAGDRPETVWIDEDYARLQRMIDATLKDTHNQFRRTPAGDKILITSYSDRQPVKWYLLDEKKRTLEELFSSRPWLKPEQLVEQRSFIFKTRDGLEIPGYYFLPKDRKPGERLPTVVHIHGGPFVRADFWGSGFGYREGQLMASRGYAVIVPNFRITPGLGNKIYYTGFGTYGREMLNDHEDAAKWAIAEGIADPQRICMSGASYGGYATLMSLAKFPEMFRCGIAGLMVSDMQLQLTSPAGDTFWNEAWVKFWLNVIGVKRIGDIPPEISPVNIAAKIKQPLLVYAGEDDIRTPLEQTTRMVRALERAGNKPKAVIIKPKEGHGFGKTENNVELYEAIFKFLDENIGPGSKRPG